MFGQIKNWGGETSQPDPIVLKTGAQVTGDTGLRCWF